MPSRSTIYRWVQQFLALFAQAACAHRRPVGGKWRVDETYCRLTMADMGLLLSSNRPGWPSSRRGRLLQRAAQLRRCCADFLRERAIAQTGVTPERITSPTRRDVTRLQYRRSFRVSSISVLQILEQRPGARPRPPQATAAADARILKRLASADTFCLGQALIQNPRDGSSTLTATVPRRLRLLRSWRQLAQAN